MRKIILLSAVILFFHSHVVRCQQVIDEVVAVVGDGIIRTSDIEQQILQMRMSGMRMSDSKLRCMVFQELLTQKLFYNQSLLDSLEVTNSEIESQINERINYFVRNLGSEAALEEHFNRTLFEIKEEFRDPIKEQLATQMMQREILSNIDITPNEVKKFYNGIPKDSIPQINKQIKYRQIVVFPPQSENEIFAVKERLLQIRERILQGENFKTLAVLYSEGPSAPDGGEIGYLGKGQLDPEYAKVAFTLREGQVSRIVESEFGFHIIQLIDKKGDKINTRHILMKPKVSIASALQAKAKLDSIAKLIRMDSISFDLAAKINSQDKDSRLSGGLVYNPQSGTEYFEFDQLRPADYYVIKNLKIAEISQPFESVDDKGRRVYKIITLEDEIEAHKANLKQDYTLLKYLAIENKKEEVVGNWVRDKVDKTYIMVNQNYQSCDFLTEEGWVKK